MKIPQILATSDLPIAQSPRRSVEGAGAGYDALARAGQSLTRVGEQYTDLEAKKREIASRAEAAEAKATFEVSMNDFDVDLRLTERDPDKYLARRKQHAELLRNEIEQRLSPDARTLFSPEATKAMGLASVAAKKHSNELYVDQQNGRLFNTLNALKQTSGGADLGEPTKLTKAYVDGVVAIEVQRSLVGDKVTNERLEKWKDDLLNEYARRYAFERPDEFLRVVDTHLKDLDPNKRNELVEKAVGRSKTLQNERLQQRKAYEDDIAKRLKEEKEALVVDFEQRVRAVTSQADRDALLSDLNLRASMRQVGDEDYRRLYKEITEPSKRKSDESILAAVGLDAESLYPKTTLAEIDRHVARHQQGLPGLNYEDAVKIKQQLRTTQLMHENKAEQDLVRAHNQAEQELRAALGIRPGLVVEAMKDDPAGRIYATLLPQLTRRSRLFQKTYGGTEDPLKVAQELAEAGRNAMGKGAQLKAAELTALVGSRTPASLKKDLQAKKISKSDYDYYLGLFAQMEEVNRRQESTKSSGPKPGDGPEDRK